VPPRRGDEPRDGGGVGGGGAGGGDAGEEVTPVTAAAPGLLEAAWRRQQESQLEA